MLNLWHLPRYRGKSTSLTRISCFLRVQCRVSCYFFINQKNISITYPSTSNVIFHPACIHLCNSRRLLGGKKIVFIDSRHKCFSIVRSVRNAATGRGEIALFNKPLRICVVHSSYFSFFISMTKFVSREREEIWEYFRDSLKTWFRYYSLFARSHPR